MVGAMGSRQDLFGTMHWGELRARFISGGGLKTMVDMVTAAALEERPETRESSRQNGGMSNVSSVAPEAYRPSSKPRTGASDNPVYEPAASREDIIACVEALGKFSRAPDVKQVMIDLGAVAAVCALAQSSPCSAKTRNACVRTAARLWIELVAIASGDDGEVMIKDLLAVVKLSARCILPFFFLGPQRPRSFHAFCWPGLAVWAVVKCHGRACGERSFGRACGETFVQLSGILFCLFAAVCFQALSPRELGCSRLQTASRERRTRPLL